MNLVFANAFRKNIIGADRSGDRNYSKVSLPLVDRHGNVEKYWIFAKIGGNVQDEVKRVFSEDKRGECIIKESDIGEFVYKILFKGKEFENLQFYTEMSGAKGGLPYAIVDGKAYFLGGKEMVVTEKISAIRIQDDTKYGSADLPNYIGFSGGGGCPSSEQKALDLKLTIWRVADEEALKAYGGMSRNKEPAISEIQFVGLFLDVMHPIDALRAPAQAVFGGIAANDADGPKVKEISQIVQGFAASGQNGGDYGEDDGPKFRRYDRIVRKFNATMKRRLDLLAAQEGPAVQHAEQPVIFMPGKPAEKWHGKRENPLPVAARARQSRQPKGEIPSSGSVNAEKPKLAKPAKRKRKKPISESQNKTCQLRQDGAIRQTAKKQKAAKAVLPTVSGHPPNAKTRKKEKIHRRVARSDVFKKAEEYGMNRKKTGPKGNAVSRSGISVPKRKTFEPLTYGCPRQPVSGTRSRKQETVRVRRSGQAELRAREKQIKTDLPKTDKRSKGIMLTEKNKKRKEKTAAAVAYPKPVLVPIQGAASPSAGRHVKTGPALVAGISSVSPFAIRAVKSKKPVGRKERAGSWAKKAIEAEKGGPANSKKQAERRMPLIGGAKRRRGKLSEMQRALWITGFSTLFSRRRPRAGRQAA